LCLRHAKEAATVIVVRTVVNPDPAARRNLVEALTGRGAPDGVRACVERDDLVSVTFDDAVTRAEQIDDLITIETHFVPAAGLDKAASARLAAVGLDEADLDSERHRVGLE
jgi:hypothetical protein